MRVCSTIAQMGVFQRVLILPLLPFMTLENHLIFLHFIFPNCFGGTLYLPEHLERYAIVQEIILHF